jgi:hypothetical protein
MVKRPLTRIAYPRALAPASLRPLAIEPDLCRQLATSSRFGHLEPPPTVLLSAEEAKGRLREIIEGFFFGRRPSDRKRRFLTKKGPGKPGPISFSRKSWV